jgi:hypothetical protein
VAHRDFIFPAIFTFLEIAGNAGTTLHMYNIGISAQNAISFHSFMARILSFAVHHKEIFKKQNYCCTSMIASTLCLKPIYILKAKLLLYFFDDKRNSY